MGLIEFQGDTIVVTLRKDGVNKTVSPLLVEVFSEWGFPAQLIIPDGKKYIDDVIIDYQPDIGDLLSITFVLREETPPRSQLVTPFYIIEKDSNGRVTTLRIPYVSRWADEEIVKELQEYIVTYPPAEGTTTVEETTTEGTTTVEETITTEVAEEEKEGSPPAED